ncbi:MAG: hypothetical protein RLZZ292_674 [Bacteroidota bacterium]|jgi:hypothetical protein
MFFLIKKVLKLFLIVCLKLFCFSVQAQNGISIAPNLHLAKLIKHSQKITFPLPSQNIGLEVNVKFLKYGQAPWHEARHFPYFGLAGLYYNLGNKEILGEAVAFVPNIGVPIARKKNWETFFQFGAGIAYLTKFYDINTNPHNTAIGSNVNNCTQFKVESSWRLSAQHRFTAGGSFTHFSNGAAQYPNLGINLGGLDVGYQYTPQPVERLDFIQKFQSNAVQQHWGAVAYGLLAWKEALVPRGPRYPVYVASVGAMYRLNQRNRVFLCADYEYQRHVHDFVYAILQYSTPQEANLAASRIGIGLGEEFLFGRWAVYLQASTYLGHFSVLVPGRRYNRISMRHYLPPFKKDGKTQVYLAAHLKTHKIVAEYIAYGMGVVF